MTGLWSKSIRSDMDALSALVLYRTPTGWRYAVYAKGIMDGRLLEVPVSADESMAQAGLVAFLEEGTGKRVHASWEQSKQDWWTADATLE